MKNNSLKLGELMVSRAAGVNPSQHLDEIFELFSIPAFDRGESDFLRGSEIGSTKQSVLPGDVLLSKIVPHIRRAWIVTPDRGRRQIASGEWIVFRESRFHGPYLRHVLTADTFHRKFMNTVAGVGGSLLRARPAQVAAIEVPLPALEEQRRIAAILDKADELRAKRRQAIAHLDALSQSIFHSVFGDPISNNLNWPLEPFGQVTTSRLGKMLDKKAQTGTHRFPYLRNANVQWFQINTDDLLEMDFSPADQIEFALRRGDVLVCEGGEPGRAAVWEEQSPGCYFQKALHRVRPKLDVVHPQYIVHLLWALANGGGLKDHVTVATIAHLTGEKLKRMHIPVPPVELQQTFATRVAAVERLKETHRKHLAELDALFSSLQSRAFKGEL